MPRRLETSKSDKPLFTGNKPRDFLRQMSNPQETLGTVRDKDGMYSTRKSSHASHVDMAKELKETKVGIREKALENPLILREALDVALRKVQESKSYKRLEKLDLLQDHFQLVPSPFLLQNREIYYKLETWCNSEYTAYKDYANLALEHLEEAK
jgi:hypothetical protein